MKDRYLFEKERMKLKAIDLSFEILKESNNEIKIHLQRYLKFCNKEIKNFEYLIKNLDR